MHIIFFYLKMTWRMGLNFKSKMFEQAQRLKLVSFVKHNIQ